jgi:hypothetical protein
MKVPFDINKIAFSKFDILKRPLIFLPFMILFSLRAYSFEYNNNLSLGVLGFGMSFENKEFNGCFSGHIFNFMYQLESGFGINVSPLHFSLNDNKSLITFVNTSVFYDFIKKNDDFILGPIISVNAVNYNRPNFFELHGGLRFSVHNFNRWDSDFFEKSSLWGYEFFVVELGYTYNNRDQQGFYAFIGMNLLSGLYYLAAMIRGEEIEKHQKEIPAY